MKKLNYLLSTVILFAVLVTIGCGKDDGPSQTAGELITEKLSKTWTLSTATLDNGDISDLAGLTLAFTSTSYTTNSTDVDRSPTPWPTSGSWKFASEPTDATASFRIARADGLEITATVTDTSLTLSFTFDDATHDSGRSEAVTGAWVMTFQAP